ncbi:hypothetical protein [Cupriavidus sp. WS]|uniref:hypothetical protein n=1 Tax=Cupriavidus sp. WS TaxID=1312922 RepID=UPI0012DDC93C|nr:hypothetical protein [Cupriavidus sp. WS]
MNAAGRFSDASNGRALFRMLSICLHGPWDRDDSWRGIRRASMAMLKMILVVLWLAAAVAANAVWWATHPDVAPNLSGSPWRWWLSVYGAKNASQEDDAAFVASSLCIVLLTVMVLWWRHRTGRR